MHASDSSNSNVPAFLIKLWKLVESADSNDCISWSDSGSSFIIRDQARFSKELLPLYFKHNNMASFIRQLNMYGFRKVMNYDKGGLKPDTDEMEFQHSFFLKDQSTLLQCIKRKMPSGKGSECAQRSPNPNDMLSDLESIRKKQENVDALLMAMKKENEVLWKELSLLRKKHKSQEQIIQKVIHFLVSLVRTNQGIGPKRKIARMIHDSPLTNNKSTSLASQLNFVRNKNPRIRISTLTTDQLESPKGPVIHEVTDLDTDDFEVIDSNLDMAGHLNYNSPLSPNEENHSLSSEVIDPFQSSTLSPEVSSPPEESISSPITIPLDLDNELNIAPEVLNLPGPLTDDLNVEKLLLCPENLIIGNVVDVDSEPQEDSKVVDPALEEVSLGNEEAEIAADSGSHELKSESSPHEMNYESLLCGNPKDVLISDGIEKDDKKRNDPKNNLQLALAETCPSNSDVFTNRNIFSNHVVNVEDELDWLQKELTLGNLNIDASTLLELFSSDDVINNSVLVNQFDPENSDVTKEADNDVIGKEVVQFTPSLLEVEADENENALFPDYFLESPSVLNDENGELDSQEVNLVFSHKKKKNNDYDDCISVNYQSLIDSVTKDNFSAAKSPSNRKRKYSRRGK